MADQQAPPVPPPGQSTLEDLYRQNVSGVYRYCLSRLRRHEEAEDATEQVFLKALVAWPRVRSMAVGALVPWLYRIAVNVVTDAQRSIRRKAMGVVPLEHPDPHVGPEDMALLNAQAEELWTAVNRLPPHLRAVVALRFAAGLDAAAVAAVVSKTPGAVRTDLWRALRLLRAILHQAEEEDVTCRAR